MELEDNQTPGEEGGGGIRNQNTVIIFFLLLLLKMEINFRAEILLFQEQKMLSQTMLRQRTAIFLQMLIFF